MTPLEIDAFSRKIFLMTGLDLSSYRRNQVERRLRGLMERAKAKSLSQFYRILKQDPQALEDFLDRFAINVSELFRNPERFEDLRRKVLPELFNGRPLRVWSAGCSFGAEPYTLAVILEDLERPVSYRILATDIDTAALARARNPVFSDHDMRSVPPRLRNKYFIKTDGGWAPSDVLRHRISFRHHNLLADPFEGNIDLILCRNVVIYFDDDAKDKLYRRFFDSLRPGGVLFIGATERIPNADEIGFEPFLPFFYRKPVA